jgi:hypothetical protein
LDETKEHHPESIKEVLAVDGEARRRAWGKIDSKALSNSPNLARAT